MTEKLKEYDDLLLSLGGADLCLAGQNFFIDFLVTE